MAAELSHPLHFFLTIRRVRPMFSTISITLHRHAIVLILFLFLHGCSKVEQSGGAERPLILKPKQHTAAETEKVSGTTTSNDDPPIKFMDVASSTNIDFLHVSGDCREKPFPAANGSGVAAFDYDLDGWYDLYFLNGTSFPISKEPHGSADCCYRNRSGWSFSNVTHVTGLGVFGYSTGVISGDFNRDGFPDVYVNCFGPNRYYINQGDGSFLETAEDSGISDPSWGTSAAALDFDIDGDLDLYVCNYAEWTWETNQFCGNRTEDIRIFCSPRTVVPVADKLFENLGDGRFQDVLSQAGLGRDPARGQGVIAADIDNDALVDIYVGNDINTNSLYRNRGDGSFEDLTDLAGTAVDFAGQIQAGMGVDVADIDRDGSVEVFVTNYEGEHNTFYQNLGNNVFQDLSQSKGLAAPSMKWVGWGTRFTDFDLDGWADLVITNGHTDNNLHELGRDGLYEQPPLLFRNQVGRLMQIDSPADSYFGTSHPGRSLCVADLDQDFLPDLVMGHKDQSPAILRNVSDVDQSCKVFVLSFVGTNSNRDGIGVSVEVVGASPIIRDQIKSGGSYLSSHPYTLTLCLPENTIGDLQIKWSGGQVENIKLPFLNGQYTVVESRGMILPHAP
jgi:hypothetical protein